MFGSRGKIWGSVGVWVGFSRWVLKGRVKNKVKFLLVLLVGVGRLLGFFLCFLGKINLEWIKINRGY